MSNEHEEGGIPHLPPPTPWPMVFALGMALTLGGMVVFLRGVKSVPELAMPIFGFALLLFATVMMLRDDIIAFREGHAHGEGHCQGTGHAGEADRERSHG